MHRCSLNGTGCTRRRQKAGRTPCCDLCHSNASSLYQESCCQRKRCQENVRCQRDSLCSILFFSTIANGFIAVPGVEWIQWAGSSSSQICSIMWHYFTMFQSQWHKPLWTQTSITSIRMLVLAQQFVQHPPLQHHLEQIRDSSWCGAGSVRLGGVLLIDL